MIHILSQVVAWKSNIDIQHSMNIKIFVLNSLGNAFSWTQKTHRLFKSTYLFSLLFVFIANLSTIDSVIEGVCSLYIRSQETWSNFWFLVGSSLVQMLVLIFWLKISEWMVSHSKLETKAVCIRVQLIVSQILSVNLSTWINSGEFVSWIMSTVKIVLEVYRKMRNTGTALSANGEM